MSWRGSMDPCVRNTWLTTRDIFFDVSFLACLLRVDCKIVANSAILSKGTRAMAVGILSLVYAIGVSGWIGCSTSLTTAPVPSKQDAPHEVWQLTLQLTGGFAGLDRQLELASTGELKVTDRRRGTQVTTQAPAGELAQIASMVGDLKSVDAVRESTCRDCIQYELRIQLTGRSLLLRVNDVSVVGTPGEPLVKVLTGALNRELSRQRNKQGSD